MRQFATQNAALAGASKHGVSRPTPAQTAAPARESSPMQGQAWNFSRLPVQAPRGIQLKPAVGAIDDPLEHEADRAADAVMRASPPDLQASDRFERPVVRGSAAAPSRSAETPAPPAVDNVLSEPGEPLDAASRAFFEPRFGRSFADVRIHDGSSAAAAAAAVQARAFTLGRDVVFARGARNSEGGRRLLAHELAHVVQQNGARSSAVGVLRRDPPPEAKKAVEKAEEKKADEKKPEEKKAPPNGGAILYVGMNNFGPEIRALKSLYAGRKVDITTVTTTKEEAATKTPGGTFDLTTAAGIKSFAGSLGVTAAQATEVENMLNAKDANTRDELAHLIVVYSQTEADGKDRMTRVILSGHSSGKYIYDENVQGYIYFDSLVQLAKVFPRAAGQARHVLLDACLAGTEDNVKKYFIPAFPNMQTFWGHTSLTGGGSPGRVADWATMTEKNPTKLKKPPADESNWAMGVFQSDTPVDGPALVTAIRGKEAEFAKYFSGEKVDPDNHSGPLAEYYVKARTVDLNPSTVPADDHAYAHLHADQAYRLRFWPGMVSRFWKAYGTDITAGYGTATVPNFAKMSRKEAIEAVAKFDTTSTATGAPKEKAARLLKALNDLDAKVLDDGWITP
jgi:hypothetical protein